VRACACVRGHNPNNPHQVFATLLVKLAAEAMRFLASPASCPPDLGSPAPKATERGSGSAKATERGSGSAKATERGSGSAKATERGPGAGALEEHSPLTIFFRESVPALACFARAAIRVPEPEEYYGASSSAPAPPAPHEQAGLGRPNLAAAAGSAGDTLASLTFAAVDLYSLQHLLSCLAVGSRSESDEAKFDLPVLSPGRQPSSPQHDPAADSTIKGSGGGAEKSEKAKGKSLATPMSRQSSADCIRLARSGVAAQMCNYMV
jgi:hypothetical protein